MFSGFTFQLSVPGTLTRLQNIKRHRTRDGDQVETFRHTRSQISIGPPTDAGIKDVDQDMIRGRSHFKLQACCSHVIFHVRPVWKGSDLRLILQPWLAVEAAQPEETRQAADLVNSGIRDRRVLVNWWQMVGELDTNWGFRRESGCFVSNCGSKELKILEFTSFSVPTLVSDALIIFLLTVEKFKVHSFQLLYFVMTGEHMSL